MPVQRVQFHSNLLVLGPPLSHLSLGGGSFCCLASVPIVYSKYDWKPKQDSNLQTAWMLQEMRIISTW